MQNIVAVNARNQFAGRIRSIISGPVVSEVLVDTPAGMISSLVTTSSVQDLAFQNGTQVLALFKATEVSIAKLPLPAASENSHE